MDKKPKPTAERQAATGAGLFDSALAGTVKESAQQIWLAGLGAFAKAQAEGGKVFEALVKEGTNLQKKTQSVAEDKIGEVAGRMTSMAGEVQARAGQQWDKLESIFEDRTARALGRLGVPLAKDLQALADRIDALEAKLAKLSRPAAARKPAAQTAPVVKPSARRAAARKST
jgi:poly(hydroxyalkanoate) granule-associated protein